MSTDLFEDEEMNPRDIAKAARQAAQKNAGAVAEWTLNALADEIDKMADAEVLAYSKAPVGLSNRERSKFAALQKRAEHLRVRTLEAAVESGRILTYDTQELAALLWALDIIRKARALPESAPTEETER